MWWAIAIVGTVALIFGLAKLGAGPDESTVASILTIDEKDHIWNPTGTVTLVEYSDLQCPACGAYYPILKTIKEKAADKLRIVYRHFPLRLTHKHAQIAAQATEAAANQGKFWELHDLLFERQRSWPLATDVKQTMIDYAKELGLDEAKFKTDLESQATVDRVQRDVDSGNRLRVSATPTFYLNNKPVTLPFTADELLSQVNELAG